MKIYKELFYSLLIYIIFPLNFSFYTYAQISCEYSFGEPCNISEVRVLGTENPTKDDSLLLTIRTTINWILSMLAAISLVICIYAGLQMMLSRGDDKKYKGAISLIKNTAIGLIIIGLAWMIVSVIFRLIEGITVTQ